MRLAAATTTTTATTTSETMSMRVQWLMTPRADMRSSQLTTCLPQTWAPSRPASSLPFASPPSGVWVRVALSLFSHPPLQRSWHPSPRLVAPVRLRIRGATLSGTRRVRQMRPADEASHILWWMGRTANLRVRAARKLCVRSRLSMLGDSGRPTHSLSRAVTAAQRWTEVGASFSGSELAPSV